MAKKILYKIDERNKEPDMLHFAFIHISIKKLVVSLVVSLFVLIVGLGNADKLAC